MNSEQCKLGAMGNVCTQSLVYFMTLLKLHSKTDHKVTMKGEWGKPPLPLCYKTLKYFGIILIESKLIDAFLDRLEIKGSKSVARIAATALSLHLISLSGVLACIVTQNVFYVCNLVSKRLHISHFYLYS